MRAGAAVVLGVARARTIEACGPRLLPRLSRRSGAVALPRGLRLTSEARGPARLSSPHGGGATHPSDWVAAVSGRTGHETAAAPDALIDLVRHSRPQWMQY